MVQRLLADLPRVHPLIFFEGASPTQTPNHLAGRFDCRCEGNVVYGWTADAAIFYVAFRGHTYNNSFPV